MYNSTLVLGLVAYLFQSFSLYVRCAHSVHTGQSELSAMSV